MGIESIYAGIRPFQTGGGPLDDFQKLTTLQALLDDRRLKQMELGHKEQMLPLQLDELRLKNAQHKQLSDIIQQAYGEQPTAGSPGVAGGAAPDGFERELRQAQALGLVDPARGRAAMEALKLKYPELQWNQGVATNPRSGAFVRSMPFSTAAGDSVQVMPDATAPGGFRITTPPGANEALSQGQRIREAAKADFDPFLGQLDAEGRPIPQTRGQFARGISGMPQAPARPPMASTPTPSAAPTPQGMGPTPFQRRYAEEQGQLVPKWEEKLGTDAAGASAALAKLNDAEQALKNFTPGKLAPFKKSMGEWLVGSGIMTQKEADEKFGGISDMQKFTSAMRELVATRVRATDAQPTIIQVKMMEEAYPQLVQTGKAAELLLQTLIRDTSVPLMKAETYKQFKENGGNPQDYQKFENWFNTKFVPNYRSDLVKQYGSLTPSITGLPQPKPAAPGAYPRARNPQTGEEVIYKDGKWQKP